MSFWVGGAVLVGAVGSAVIGEKSAGKAAGAAKAGTDATVGENQRQFDLVRSDTANLRGLSDQSVGMLSKLNAGDSSAFHQDPGYQFALEQGQRSIDNSAAARGGLLSGGAVKAGARFATGLADQQYGSFYDRLLQSAGLGNTGIGASASAGASAAGNIGAAYTNGAAMRGSAYLQGGQAVNGAVQGGVSNLLLSRYLGTSGGGGAGIQAGNGGYGIPTYGYPA